MTHWTEELFLDDAETFAVTMRQRVEGSALEIDSHRVVAVAEP
jgi:hypothetical protein